MKLSSEWDKAVETRRGDRKHLEASGGMCAHEQTEKCCLNIYIYKDYLHHLA